MNKNSAHFALARTGVAWFAAVSLALTLSACGGSDASPSAAQKSDASAPVENTTAVTPDTPAAPATSDTPTTPDTPATPAAPTTPDAPTTPATPDQPASDATPTGFQVGTTTYDPALPPEPTLPLAPQICATLPATLTAQANGLLPDSADATDTAPDSARIQAALDACKNPSSTGLATNKAVRLVPGANGANAFIAGALTLSSGVTLWIDKGVTLYASRDPRQYDKTKGTASCGMITASDNGCLALINASKIANGAVVGDGVIDGRGGSPLISSVPNDPNLMKRPDGSGTMSWWDIGWMANKVLNQAQNNPRLIQISNGRNFTLYRVTLQNAPKFHVVPSGIDGFTAWGVKIYTPTAAYEAMKNYLGMPYSPDTAKNTDGIDPGSSGPITSNAGNPGKLLGDASNMLIAYTHIRTGDDNMAIKGGTGTVNGRTYNITVAHSHFYTGHGMSIGSESAGTDNGAANPDVTPVNGVLPSVSNVKVYDLVIDGADNGLRIKSDWSRSGLIAGISYSNVCIRTPDASPDGKPQALIFSPYYSPTKNNGLYPNFQNIALDGVRIVNASSYTFLGFNSASPILQGSGWSGGPSSPIVNPLTISLNNVVADIAPSSFTVANALVSIGEGGTTLPFATGGTVNVTRAAANAASAAPVDCSKAFTPFPAQ
ncbi:glycoside hydrolase family protein [Caballeronia temeraria]|uniref:Glycoside hydrolase family protein n=1 Tax=Caballeronia temeraria TaxID=1777137 RepID=A0A157ZUQ2_9BURK|nr:glycosyl hydrolase family 28 protein [Caballeronia temeraria]SAK49235.1 glycoside hydrolase family protein [Caballeronia temeraria]